MPATVTNMTSLKVTFDERIAAAARQAAAAASVAPEKWVNDQLARVLLLRTLDRIQERNPEPLTEQAAERVVYDHERGP